MALLSAVSAFIDPGFCEDEASAIGVKKKMGFPLRVCSNNPIYFADLDGHIVYLTGSHTWNNFQDIISDEYADPFDYDAYLDFMEDHNHNFMRLWTWEQAAWISSVEGMVRFSPMPYPRSGPVEAIDGKPRFDLSRFDEAYFTRLRDRVAAAGERGIHVAVMLFQGFGIEVKTDEPENRLRHFLASILSSIGLKDIHGPENNPWRGHPFNAANNINGIDGDPQGRGDGRGVHTLAHPEITRLQEAYVRKVIDTLHDLDNVIWEIANESHADSTEWQYHMIRFIQAYEQEKGRRHPVLMTVQWPDGDNDVLFASPADAISPNTDGGYRDAPPPADGSKVIISDTDHLWGIGGSVQWVWQTFLMGMHPILMDPYQLPVHGDAPGAAHWEPIRRAMGQTRQWAEKVPLARMAPRPELASSGYCLAWEGEVYLVYVPAGEEVRVDLSGVRQALAVTWYDTGTGGSEAGRVIEGGAPRSVTSPFTNDGLLYLTVERKP